MLKGFCYCQVDVKTTALAMAITDSELSDEEASILESGGFSVSRATTPQLTDVSEGKSHIEVLLVHDHNLHDFNLFYFSSLFKTWTSRVYTATQRSPTCGIFPSSPQLRSSHPLSTVCSTFLFEAQARSKEHKLVLSPRGNR